MATEKTTRRVYSAEELQRLRVKCSQPKLREAIEELDGDDAELVKACTTMSDSILTPGFDVHRAWIEEVLATPTPAARHKKTTVLTGGGSPTEHVLRGTKSWPARSFRSRASGNSLRVPSNKENRSTADATDSRHSSELHAPIPAPAVSILGEIAPNGQRLRSEPLFRPRPSPTPSLKKKKVEAIVKAHGSPQHIRVTAGGRIVPSEQSPLCHPRYGYSAIKANGGLIKFAPNQPMGKAAQWTQATQNGFVAQDVNGRLCQIVNGTILPLNEVDGALRLFVPAPNLNVSSRGSSFAPSVQGRVDTTSAQQRTTSQGKPPTAPDPPLPAQTNALELEYSKLEHELKELDKTEALHGRTMPKTAKEALVAKRRELVVSLDSIRKAIKSIKSAPPPEAPLSPRSQEISVSPPGDRLPASLQQRPQQSIDMTLPSPPAFNQFYGVPPQAYAGAPYAGQTTPSPEAPFAPAYQMPSFFMPPPPFDGSMASAYGAMPEGFAPPVVAAHPIQPTTGVQDDGVNYATQLPQNDGAHSIRDIPRPRSSHAVDIKAPEPKPAASLKSRLNPESPAYKPGAGLLKTTANTDRPALKSIKDRAPTPLSPMHQLRPPTKNNAARASDGTISQTKKSPHLHSSSVSSFNTADFFPSNTREYSTRKYNYPEQSEDKENMPPRPSVDGSAVSPATPLSDQSEIHHPVMMSGSDYKAPTAPPGTPVTAELAALNGNTSRQLASNGSRTHQLDRMSLPNRSLNNLSPKSKRQDFVFVEEHPSQFSAQSSSSPAEKHQCQDELCVTASPVGQLDFTNASRDWIEGYRAGLARRSVPSDRHGEFLDGYCAGLLKSKPTVAPTSTAAATTSTGSPSKQISRRPSPALLQTHPASKPGADRREQQMSRPPLEIAQQSMDTLKQAVFAPQNEQAILSPSAEEPHVDGASFNLGAWASRHEQARTTEGWTTGRGEGLAGFPFPHRTASMMERQGYGLVNDASLPQRHDSVTSKASQGQATAGSTVSSIAVFQGVEGIAGTSGNRISSVTSIDSHLYRQLPGYRVFSAPLEWKSASSIAQAAGLASGQFSGMPSEGLHASSTLLHTTADFIKHTDDTSGPTSGRPMSILSAPAMHSHGRFKEGSLDGITTSPKAPSDIPIPPSSKNNSPGKDSKKSSPSKGTSPAKMKFEHIAEKVGIKVSIGGSGKKDDGAGAPSTPPGKRYWRSVWRGKDGASASTN